MSDYKKVRQQQVNLNVICMSSFIMIKEEDYQQLISVLERIERKVEGMEGAASTAGSDQLCTVKQAAELLNLAVPTIYSLVSRRVIPFNKKGKRLYFSKQELINWIKTGRKKTYAEIEKEADRHFEVKKGGEQ